MSGVSIDGESPRRRFVLPLVFGIVIAVLGAVALVLRAMAATPTIRDDLAVQHRVIVRPSPRVLGTDHMVAVICAVRQTPDAHGSGTDTCRRMAEDMMRRPQLDDEQRAAARAVAERLRGMMTPRLSGPATEADAELYQRALMAAGFPDATARPARAGDPAPEGALLYAVGAGTACVVGWRDSGGGNEYVAGRLPSGNCLDS